MDEKGAKLLLKLCSDLHDDNPQLLQVKLNKYIEERTSAECAFIFVVSEDEDVMICQVVGKRILDEERKFPENNNSFSTVLTLKRPIRLSDIEVCHREDVCKLTGLSVRSLLCIPVCNRNGNIVLLACVVNRRNADGFTKQDMDVISECFDHTAPGLLKALAYEKEKRLRIQCQSLLTVAKNLFTHLGEYTIYLGEVNSVDDIPPIPFPHLPFSKERTMIEPVRATSDNDLRRQRKRGVVSLNYGSGDLCNNCASFDCDRSGMYSSSVPSFVILRTPSSNQCELNIGGFFADILHRLIVQNRVRSSVETSRRRDLFENEVTSVRRSAVTKSRERRRHSTDSRSCKILCRFGLDHSPPMICWHHSSSDHHSSSLCPSRHHSSIITTNLPSFISITN